MTFKLFITPTGGSLSPAGCGTRSISAREIVSKSQSAALATSIEIDFQISYILEPESALVPQQRSHLQVMRLIGAAIGFVAEINFCRD